MWDQSTSLNSNERQPLLHQGGAGGARGPPPIGTQSQITNNAVANLVNLLTGLVNQVKEFEQSVQLIGTARESPNLKNLANSQVFTLFLLFNSESNVEKMRSMSLRSKESSIKVERESR